MRLKRFFPAEAPAEVELATAQAASYAAWQSACQGVAAAYQSWIGAARSERWLAHAAYVEALDHEERTAGAYQQLVEHARCPIDGGGGHASAHAISR
jgi:hypothetical protein